MNKVKVKKIMNYHFCICTCLREYHIAEKLGSHKMEKPSSQKATENTQTLLKSLSLHLGSPTVLWNIMQLPQSNLI